MTAKLSCHACGKEFEEQRAAVALDELRAATLLQHTVVRQVFRYCRRDESCKRRAFGWKRAMEKR